jgi:formamidopyrimidine-DNA glycosylase
MPELPEVETVCRGLRTALVGKRLVNVTVRRPDLRLPFPENFARRLLDREVLEIERLAKYILVRLSGDLTLLVHLGMTGRFTIVAPSGRAVNLGEFYFETQAEEGGVGAHDHVTFRFDDGTAVTFTDPRRFGVMDLIEGTDVSAHRLLKGLGTEPLAQGFNLAHLRRLFEGRRAPLKAALMDQRVVAGLGNIYACEALFRAGLSPRRMAGTLVRRGRSDKALARLVAAVRQVLKEAIRAGGSTLRDYADADGAAGRYQNRFRVYGREGKPCPRKGCRGRVKRIVQAGRSTFYCPVCQR